MTERTAYRPNPTSVHWLGDRYEAESTQHAREARGCVLYFVSKDECLKFMNWLESLTEGQP